MTVAHGHIEMSRKMLQIYREASIWVERGPATRRIQKQTIRNSAFSGEYTIHNDMYSNINFKLYVSQALRPVYMVTTLFFLILLQVIFQANVQINTIVTQKNDFRFIWSLAIHLRPIFAKHIRFLGISKTSAVDSPRCNK